MSHRFLTIRAQAICLSFALSLGGQAVFGAPDSNQAKEPLNPSKHMPTWFWDVAHEYRIPIPVDFDFAYIDNSGKSVISGPFTCAESFHNGRAVVRLGHCSKENGRWTFEFQTYTDPLVILDTNGRVIIPAKDFGTIHPFFEDTCTASTSGAGQDGHTIIDKQGKIIRELKTASKTGDTIGELSEGLAAVGGANGTIGFTDTTGNIKLKTQAGFTASRFSDGMAKVRRNWWAAGLPADLRMTPAELDKLKHDPTSARKYQQKIEDWRTTDTGYINREGKLVIPIQFEHGRDFHEGLAAVKKDGKWGYINQKGSMVIPPQYAYAGDFGEDLAPVDRGGKFGFIDKSGNEKIPFKFAAAKEFAAGMAPATVNGSDWGYIDKSGSFKIAPTFKQAFPFDSGRALVFVVPEAESFVPEKSALAPAIFYQSGIQARRALSIEEARECFKKVIEIDPKSDYAKRAMQMLKTALPAKPVPKEIVLEYSKAAAMQRTDPDKALASLKECIKRCPDFEWPYGQAASVLLELERPDEAIELLNTALKRNKNYMRGHLWLAQALKAKGETKSAKDEMEIARQLNPYDELLLLLSIANPKTK